MFFGNKKQTEEKNTNRDYLYHRVNHLQVNT